METQCGVETLMLIIHHGEVRRMPQWRDSGGIVRWTKSGLCE